MPPRAKIHILPEEIKDELNARLIASGFGGYQELADWLQSEGYEISRSAVHRYGEQMERKIEAIRLATEQAKALTQAIPDDENAMLDAAYRLAQEQIYQVLLSVEFDPSEAVSIDKFSRLLRALAEMGRGSVNLKKYQQDIRAQVREAQAKVAELARGGGLSEETIRLMELELGAIG